MVISVLSGGLRTSECPDTVGDLVHMDSRASRCIAALRSALSIRHSSARSPIQLSATTRFSFTLLCFLKYIKRDDELVH